MKKFKKRSTLFATIIAVALVAGLAVPAIATGNVGIIEDGDLFTIVNGYGSLNSGILNYPGLNNRGDLFYIGVIDSNGNEYASYCANAGSVAFHEGEKGYMVAHSSNESKWMQAFNYINDYYGDITETGVMPSSARSLAACSATLALVTISA